jgi:hypothetical protein
MATLETADLVDLWEQGYASGLATRAFLLLSRTRLDLSEEELETLPVGTCNDLLLQLREQIFGPELESLVPCQHCHEALEITVNVRALRVRQVTHEAPGEWTNGDLVIRFRVPTSGDLLELQECENEEEARQRLLERCMLEASRKAEAIDPAQLTAEEASAFAEHVGKTDPGAEIILNGICPHCGHQWESSLDIALFLWHELDTHVRHLLSEVHLLAWAYGWHERDILAMSSRRRQIYLDLLGQ